MKTVTLSNLSAGEYSRLLEARGAAAYRVAVPSDGVVALQWSPGGKIKGLNLSGRLEHLALATFFGDFYMKWLATVSKAVVAQSEFSFLHMLQTADGPVPVRHCIYGSSPECAVGLLMEESGRMSTAAAVQERAPLGHGCPESLDCLEQLPMGVYYIDTEFRLRWANDSAMRLSNCDWRENYGQRCYEHIASRDSPCEDCPVERTLKDGRLHVSEKNMPWGDIWNLISIPAFDNEGQQLGAIEVVSDVTTQVREHKQATELLKRQQERLKAQIEILKYLQNHYAMDGVDFLTSPETVTEAVVHTLESSTARFWIMEKGELRCLDCYDALDGVHMKNISAPGRVLDYFLEHVSSKGLATIADVLDDSVPECLSRHYLSQGLRSVLCSPVKIRTKLLGFVVVAHCEPHVWMPEEQSFALAITDFVALCMNQRSLDEHRRRVQTLLTNLPGAAFRMRYGRQGVLVDFLSEGSVHLTGIPVQEIIGKMDVLKEIIFEEDYEEYHSTHLREYAVNDTVESLFRFRSKDGSLRWALERCKVIDMDAEENIVVYEGFTHDITEQMRLREAELASESKSNFLAAMSHELRTPLNAIIGFSRKLESCPMPVDQRQNLVKMQSAARMLLDLVNGILDFSNIESGNLTVRNEQFSLVEVLSGIETIFTGIAEQKDLSFDLAADTAVPDALIGDSLHISQVLINLVGNAIKFTDRGSVAVMCDVADSSPDGILLRFTIADTGIGIAPEKRESIFAPFVQADASTSRRHGGVGLGLSIARALVELMEGKIEIQSEVGRGTLCTFTCRVREQRREILDTGFDFILPQFRGQRILLVEDNLINREIALSLLEDVNLQVTAAENGKEALDILLDKTRSAPFDLVLMDVQMPVMDGLEATRILRAHKDTADIPIVAMTAHCLESEKRRCFASGMNGHISKPVDILEMYTTLALFLGGETEQ